MFPLGHLGATLLVATPVVLRLRRRDAVAFTVVALVTAPLPDLDNHLPFLVHHGVTHTVLFAVVAGVAGGLAVGGLAAARRHTGRALGGFLSPRRAASLGAAGGFVGVLGHVLADVLAVMPVGSPDVEPFWPFFDASLRVTVWSLGVVPRNLLLLTGGLAVHAAIYWWGVEASASRAAG